MTAFYETTASDSGTGLEVGECTIDKHTAVSTELEIMANRPPTPYPHDPDHEGSSSYYSIPQIPPQLLLSAGSHLCQFCAEEKDAKDFPSPSTVPTGCHSCLNKHHQATCTSCMRVYFTNGFRSFHEDAAVACPWCLTPWPYQFVQNFMSAQDFAEYDRWLFRRCLNKIPEFRHCLNAQCGSGRIVNRCDPGWPMVTCADCGSKTCYRDQVPWHEGLTCSQYEKSRPKNVMQEELASRQTMRDNETRECPGCRTGVEKVDGCNHVTCTNCGKDFLFDKARLVKASNKIKQGSPRDLMARAKEKMQRVWHYRKFLETGVAP